MTITESSDPKVNEFINSFDHPNRELALTVREVVLRSDERILDAIKWKCICFTYKKNVAQLIPAKEHIKLMIFNSGNFNDPTGLLEGDGPTHKGVKFTTSEIDEETFGKLITQALDQQD